MIETYVRVIVKAMMLLFGAIALALSFYGESAVVKSMVAIWMLMSAGITAFREIRNGYVPTAIAIVEMSICVLGLVWVIGALALAWYEVKEVPSSGTLLAFTLFWSTHIALQIQRMLAVAHVYLVVTLIGLIGLIGYLTDVPQLRFKFDLESGGMALSTSLFLIVLGLVAHSRERAGP